MPGQLKLFGDADDEPTAPRVPRLAMLERRLVEYELVRSRRRTLLVSVDANGLSVRAPLRATQREIDAFLINKRRWILDRLDEWAGTPRAASVSGASGESLPLFGDPIVLDVRAGRNSVSFDNAVLRIATHLPERRAKVRALLVAWLKAQALAALTPRVLSCARLLGRPVAGVRLSNAHQQWGVCTQSGLIRLSWRLVHVAPRLADYVVAHEVAHLVELNHSKRFWRLVESLYPDWRLARSELERAARAIPQIRG